MKLPDPAVASFTGAHAEQLEDLQEPAFLDAIHLIQTRDDGGNMMRVWKKPVVVFYKQRFQEPERRAFAVVKARRLQIVASEREKARNSGAVYSTSFLSWKRRVRLFKRRKE